MTTGSVSELTELAEIREELRAVARDLLGQAAPGAEPGWRQLAASGWLGLEVPDELDGAGVTFAEVAVIAEELGRAAARTPYLGAIVLGVGLLQAIVPDVHRDELLARTAAGQSVPVAVCTGPAIPGTALPGDRAFSLGPDPDGQLRLRGRASFVPDAAGASHLLVLADQAGEPVVAVLAPGVAGLTVTATPVLDETRSLAEVSADGAVVPPEAVWRLVGDPDATLRQLGDRAAVALACDSLGVAAFMLDATVAYAKVRHQFGRPIGSFQAVKHACADLLVRVTVARELTVTAAAAVAGRREASVAASMAKSYACAAAVAVAGQGMQLHGGVGYAQESGIHAYLKRAALNRDLFGSPAAHRARLAERYRTAST